MSILDKARLHRRTTTSDCEIDGSKDCPIFKAWNDHHRKSRTNQGKPFAVKDPLSEEAEEVKRIQDLRKIWKERIYPSQTIPAPKDATPSKRLKKTRTTQLRYECPSQSLLGEPIILDSQPDISSQESMALTPKSPNIRKRYQAKEFEVD